MQSITKLLEIAHQSPNVEAALPIDAVTALFRRESDLTAVPIVESGSFIGIVSKSQLYKALSQAFALDIYSRRSIGSLLDKQAIFMDPQRDIHTALSSLLETDPSLSIDSIAIVSGGKCQGIVPVSSLLMSISRSQSALLQMLDTLTFRIRDEVKKAADIQQALLPLSRFRYPAIGIAAELKTCSEVGGDFFDYFTIDTDRLCVIIADVSGHGVQAGMITTAAKASLHTLVRQGVATPGTLLSCMNESILKTTRKSLLMTCLIAVINPARKQICYANAGHNFPYVCSKANHTIRMLENPPTFPLGFDSNSSFKEITIPFNPGDTLVLYSDGVNECSNGLEDYGYANLESCMFGLIGKAPEEWVRQILNSLSNFRGSEPLRDDVTMVVAHFEETA